MMLAFVVSLVLSSSQAAEPSYYTVHDGTQPSLQSANQETSLQPLEAFSYLAATAAQAAADMDLMSWDHHQTPLVDPPDPYDRKSQYGTWVRDPRDQTCYNTRAKVLIRSSSVPVTFSGGRGCTVKTGQWHDPYSDRQYSDAADLQIDHVVPLKNSYISGGWKWDQQKKCLYANFLSNDFHLLAVDGGENMRKSDRTPEQFMPSNRAYACEYLSIWLKIKLIWNLAMTPSEANAISQLAQQNHCDSSILSIASKELRQQRQEIVDNMVLCAH